MNKRLNFLLKISTVIRRSRVVGSYISEIGRVAFIATAVFGLLAAIGEITYPGFVINWISPKSIIQLGIIAGLLALWPANGISEHKAGWLEGILGLFFSVIAFVIAWYYFEPIIESQFGISLVVVLVVGLSFYLLVYGDYLKRQDRN